MNLFQLDPEYRRQIEAHGGFAKPMSQHIVGYIPRSKKLLVCFGGIGDTKLTADRTPWATSIARDLGWSHLGNIAFREDWYRHSQMFQFYRSLAAEGFFSQFDEVVFYGTSMGGYAAAAFSGACPGARVVALSPQSTLMEQKARFEKRFQAGRRLGKWDRGPWKDAARTIKLASKVDVFVDPFHKTDLRHFKRLQTPVTHLHKVFFGGHACANSLAEMGILAELTKSAILGSLSPNETLLKMRARSLSAGHHERVLRRAFLRDHPELALRHLKALCVRTQHPRWSHLYARVDENLSGTSSFSWPYDRSGFGSETLNRN